MALLFFIGLFFLVLALYIFGKGKGTPVLLYHQVNPLINVTPELFEEHLIYIASRYQTFTYTEAYEYVRVNSKLPVNSLLITFDDGYWDNYKVVFPLLKKYNLKATFFINTLFIGQDARTTEPAFEIGELANIKALTNFYEGKGATSAQYMTAPEMQEMTQSGVCDFQAHTHTHAPVFISDELTGFRSREHSDSSPIHLYQGKVEEGYPIFKSRSTVVAKGYRLDVKAAKQLAQEWRTHWKQLPKQEAIAKGKAYIMQHPMLAAYSELDAQARVIEEIKINKELLQQITGRPVNFFAWTWGHKSDWGRDIIRKQGIIGFVTTKKGGIGLKPDWLNLKRVEFRNPSMKKFKKNLAITSNSFTSWIYSTVS
jgi:peptidoglycan/xylan/chitin deacetylase (PgdA/CDA1 family)